MTDRYAVIGNPVEHSKSPQIHHFFSLQTGRAVQYDRVLAPLDGFASTVKRLQQEGYKGCNVTVPFKQEAFQLSLPQPRAKFAEAVNTLSFLPDHVVGDNTDGVGLVRDIMINLGVSLQQQRVLLLGAGGASRGVLHPLLAETPLSLVIANRSLDKATNLRDQVLADNQALGNILEACRFEDLSGRAFDVVINATSTGLSGERLPLPSEAFMPNTLAYDMMYGRETSFMLQAREKGAQVADGLGMLVEQAAEAFYLWQGVRPDTAPVINYFRA